MELQAPLTKFEQDLVDNYQSAVKKAEELKNKVLQSAANLGNVTASFDVTLSINLKIDITSYSDADLTKSILLNDTDDKLLRETIYLEANRKLDELIDSGNLNRYIDIKID